MMRFSHFVDFTGDLSLALDPHPVVPSATPSLDVTTEIQLSEEEEESFSRTGAISKEDVGIMSDQRPSLLPTRPPGEDGVRSTSPVQVETKTTFEVPSEQGEKSLNGRSLSNLFCKFLILTLLFIHATNRLFFIYPHVLKSFIYLFMHT